MGATSAGFDGPIGRVAATVMARVNRDMEDAALDLLAPRDGEVFLIVGFGPGVGIELLFERCDAAHVTAVDPARAMVAAAGKRLGRHRWAPRVDLIQREVAACTFASGAFDAVVAVNSHQLWKPHDASVAVVAGALRPGGRLVTLTHDWAIERASPLERWKEEVTDDLLSAGFESIAWSRSNYRSGSATALTATRGAMARRRAID